MKFRYIICLLWVVIIALTSVVRAQDFTYATSINSQSMIAVLDHYCQSLNPITRCGVYQHDITQAELRASHLVNMMKGYSENDKKVVLEGLLQRMSRAFYNAPDTNTKVVSAYYYVYLSGKDISGSTDDLYSYLFQNGNTPREITRTTYQQNYVQQRYYQARPEKRESYRRGYHTINYDYDDYNDRYDNNYTKRTGSITSITSLNNNTSINRNSKIIELENSNNLSVGVRINDSSLDDATYSVVATFPGENNTYDGNYTRNGTWEFYFGSNIKNERSITFSLLCEDCNTGARYNKSPYSGWTTLDSITYSLEIEEEVQRKQKHVRTRKPITPVVVQPVTPTIDLQTYCKKYIYYKKNGNYSKYITNTDQYSHYNRYCEQFLSNDLQDSISDDCSVRTYHGGNKHCDDVITGNNNGSNYGNNYGNTPTTNSYATISIKGITHDYEKYANSGIVDVETVIRNNSSFIANYSNGVDLRKIEYRVKLNHKKLSEGSNYTVTQRSITCNSGNNRYGSNHYNGTIDSYGECTIKIQIALKQNIANSNIEVQVKLPTKKDTNNTRSTSFRVD